MQSKTIFFMIASRFNRSKYIKYLIPSIVFICCSLYASEFRFSPGSEESELTDFSHDDKEFPFSSGPGYVSGGMPFPHAIETEAGGKFSIADLKGNVVVLMISTTWCPNCPAALQSLDSLVEKLGDQKIKNVRVIALNIGNESVGYLKIHYKANNIQLLEVYNSISSKTIRCIPGVPACLVFDKKGIPVWGYLGAASYDSSEFLAFIKRLAQ
ncbi:MAG: TlpA family protein disulfide reductase [Holosporaceae bacterium]|jgi:thiol-disulfide isomerase/thioredoxin|nr:TlpA family protein disulfide reductase [Holosporaceae bacterium]